MKNTESIVNKKPKPFNLRFLVWCLIACLVIASLLLGMIAWCLSRNNIKIEDLKVATPPIRITDDNFVDTVIKNSKMQLNKSYYLDDKITLDSDKLSKLEGAGALSFYGTLDGCGNEISIEAPMSKPLFNQITDGSTVKQLAITFKNSVEVKNSNAKSIAVLANINNGTIENVKISDAKVDTNGVSVAGGIAAYNFNQINYCTISIYFAINSDYTNIKQPGVAANWKCAVGAVAGINCGDGRVMGAIVSTMFTNNFVVLTRQLYKNSLVGYSIGRWGNSDTISDIHIINGLYQTTAHDISELRISGNVLLNTLNDLTADNFTQGKWNDDDGWHFEEGKLPFLKSSQIVEA